MLLYVLDSNSSNVKNRMLIIDNMSSISVSGSVLLFKSTTDGVTDIKFDTPELASQEFNNLLLFLKNNNWNSFNQGDILITEDLEDVYEN